MGQWEPLADRIPLDMRRLATQLRRMKDRSGLTVPALAARTAESADAWAGYLAARTVPPLAAVEVLAQLSGADYDRTGALWKLAEKASTGTGDRGRGKPLPQPDPLDPLSAQDGLPARRRRILALAAVGLLAVAALLAVVLMAGTSNGRAPGRDAAPTGAPTAAGGTPVRTTPSRGRTGQPGAGVPGRGKGSGTPGGTPASTVPAATPPATEAAAGDGSAPPPPPSAGTTGQPTAPQTPSASPTGAPTPSGSGTPTPSPTHTGLCLGLIVLGVCVG